MHWFPGQLAWCSWAKHGKHTRILHTYTFASLALWCIFTFSRLTFPFTNSWFHSINHYDVYSPCSLAGNPCDFDVIEEQLSLPEAPFMMGTLTMCALYLGKYDYQECVYRVCTDNGCSWIPYHKNMRIKSYFHLSLHSWVWGELWVITLLVFMAIFYVLKWWAIGSFSCVFRIRLQWTKSKWNTI